jgi:hypothetical protein
MKLEDYVYETWSPERPGNPFPSHLEIPHDLIVDFRELYKLTESRGQECGYLLFYEGKSWPIRHDPVTYGLPTSMNIPKSQSYYNFGNIHAHPSASIGHNGGYSPHSMYDLLTFKDVADRKIFIQFVVSGPKLYAMVFRHGWSRVSDAVQKFAGDRYNHDQAEGWAHVVRKNFRNENEYYDKMPTSDEHSKDVWKDQLKRQAGFGKKMEELSIASCTEFARQFGYGFYIGKTEGFGTGKIYIQK